MQCSDRRKLMWMTLNITTIVLILFTGEKNKNYIYVKILLILLFKSVQFVDELELVFDNLTIKAMNIGTVIIIIFYFFFWLLMMRSL